MGEAWCLKFSARSGPLSKDNIIFLDEKFSHTFKSTPERNEFARYPHVPWFFLVYTCSCRYLLNFTLQSRPSSYFTVYFVIVRLFGTLFARYLKFKFPRIRYTVLIFLIGICSERLLNQTERNTNRKNGYKLLYTGWRKILIKISSVCFLCVVTLCLLSCVSMCVRAFF